jgi:hypothetical protein
MRFNKDHVHVGNNSASEVTFHQRLPGPVNFAFPTHPSSKAMFNSGVRTIDPRKVNCISTPKIAILNFFIHFIDLRDPPSQSAFAGEQFNIGENFIIITEYILVRLAILVAPLR